MAVTLHNIDTSTINSQQHCRGYSDCSLSHVGSNLVVYHVLTAEDGNDFHVSAHHLVVLGRLVSTRKLHISCSGKLFIYRADSLTYKSVKIEAEEVIFGKEACLAKLHELGIKVIEDMTLVTDTAPQ